MLLIVTLLLGQLSLSSARDLVFVQAIWRHGDRAPLKMPYPNDAYGESAWQRGWGKLTTLGMQQAYELGIFFRNRYQSFISSAYHPSEVYIRSSDVDRALTTGQVFAWGLFPASGSAQWQAGNTWQPIPIHATTPKDPDLLVMATTAVCKKVNELVEAEYAEQAKYYDVKYAEMFKVFAQDTGIANFSYHHINGIYDIKREITNNMTANQPQWVFKNWTEYGGQSTMDIVTELRRVRMITNFNSTEKAKLKGGYLLYTWLQTAQHVANGTMTEPNKMMLYSSHDGTVLPLMYAMGVANDLMLPYTSTLIMEIYKDGNDYNVELLLRNDTSLPPYPLTIPDCPSPCTVPKLVEKTSSMVLTGYEEQQELCGTPVKRKYNGSSMASYCLALLVLISLR